MEQPDGASRNLSFKVVLLGEGAVGKTSIVLRYMEDKFTSTHISTVQAAFFNKKLIVDGNNINLSIWDTAGQEKFHALGPIYYRDSNGAILIYDITDEDSFQKVKNWVKELRKILGNQVSLCIVGNKTDLEKERNVSHEDAKQYADLIGAKHFNTSAKFNNGVDELFETLARSMLEKSISSEPVNNSSARQRQSGLIIRGDEPAEDASSRKCGC